MKRIFLCLAVLLTGCASSYDKFYTPIATESQVTQLALLQDGKQPQIFRVNDIRTALHEALQKGYIPIGESNFTGKMESESALISQAKKIRATVVLSATSFSETRTINSSYTVPTTTTTFNNGTVSNGYSSAAYSGTSTTYGTQTIPFTMTVDRYLQNAVFMAAPKNPPKFGVMVGDLTPEMKRKVESNLGVYVKVVQENSISYKANILEGDILLEVNGTPLPNEAGAGPVLSDAKPVDGKYTFRLFRNGQIRTVDVPAK